VHFDASISIGTIIEVVALGVGWMVMYTSTVRRFAKWEERLEILWKRFEQESTAKHHANLQRHLP